MSAFGDSKDSASIRSSTPGPSGAARPVSQMSGIADISDSHSPEPSQSFQASVDDKDDSGADTEEEETQERRVNSFGLIVWDAGTQEC